MRTRTLGLVLGSLGLLMAAPAMALQSSNAAPINDTVAPATAKLGAHCSDPWYELSGIQWLTCAYLKNRQK